MVKGPGSERRGRPLHRVQGYEPGRPCRSVNVLVTGSTGFVGRHVVPVLRAGGHRVRCFVRPTSDRSALPEAVEWAVGDIRDPRSVAKACQGVEVAVHLVAILRERRATFEEVIVHGTRNVLSACTEAGTPLVHIGALGTTENSPSRYGQSMAKGVRLAQESDLPVTIVRFPPLVGPGSSLTGRYAAIIRRYRKVPVVGRGSNEIQPLAIADAAEAIRRAVEVPKEGALWDLAGPERVTWSAFVIRLAAAMGLRRSVRFISPTLARWVSRAGRLVGRPPLVTADELYYLQEDLIGDPQEFEKRIGRPPMDLDTALHRAVEEQAPTLM